MAADDGQWLNPAAARDTEGPGNRRVQQRNHAAVHLRCPQRECAVTSPVSLLWPTVHAPGTLPDLSTAWLLYAHAECSSSEELRDSSPPRAHRVAPPGWSRPQLCSCPLDGRSSRAEVFRTPCRSDPSALWRRARCSKERSAKSSHAECAAPLVLPASRDFAVETAAVAEAVAVAVAVVAATATVAVALGAAATRRLAGNALRGHGKQRAASSACCRSGGRGRANRAAQSVCTP